MRMMPAHAEWRTATMLLPDVNVLIYAHRVDAQLHPLYAKWLINLADGSEPFALSELVASAFVRIVTNPKVFKPATPLADALAFIDQLRALPHCHPLVPGARNWEIFSRVCRDSSAHGAIVSDAYHAALAIEHGCTFITCDGDFARFTGLRWQHPLQPKG